jgi:hypothetical protein
MTTGLRIQRARPKDTMCGPALARPISDSTRSEKFLFCQTKPFTLLPAELPRAECPAAICDRHTPQASAASQIPQGCHALLIARTNRARSFHASEQVGSVRGRASRSVLGHALQNRLSALRWRRGKRASYGGRSTRNSRCRR